MNTLAEVVRAWKRHGYIAGSAQLWYRRASVKPFGKPVTPEFGPERIRLLDGAADFTATPEQIQTVERMIEQGLDVRAIARQLHMREIDAMIVALHIYTDEKTGEVRW